jgi:hypothetical protein
MDLPATRIVSPGGNRKRTIAPEKKEKRMRR